MSVVPLTTSLLPVRERFQVRRSGPRGVVQGQPECFVISDTRDLPSCESLGICHPAFALMHYRHSLTAP